MKHQALILTFCALLLALLGCEKRPAAVSPSVGPFDVNSDTGQATGEAFGIAFEVAGASRAEVDFQLAGAAPSSSRAEITLADDLKIELETMDEGNAVYFQLNGKPIGVLKKGDQVAIDAERKVTVNGESHHSDESPPEAQE